MAKKLWQVILLAVLIEGVGHIYLGMFKRGLTILIVGLVFSAVVSLFIPIPYSWIIIIGYWAWQIYDAYKQYQKLNAGQTQVTTMK